MNFTRSVSTESFVSSVQTLLAPYNKSSHADMEMIQEVKGLLHQIDPEYSFLEHEDGITSGSGAFSVHSQQAATAASAAAQQPRNGSSGGAAVLEGPLDIVREDLRMEKNLQRVYNINVKRLFRNASPGVLYEEALRHEEGTAITSTGALMCKSGAKTGRSPSDKRIVEEDGSKDHVWWGPINIPQTDKTFMINRERAIDYLNTRKQLYIVDGYAGWDPRYRIKVRVICSRAYHALFMQNMLIMPTRDELRMFNVPDYVIYNAGAFPANMYTTGMTSNTSVSLNFARREMVILGTMYAGEMKKGVFTIMNYLMPKLGTLSMHSSCNEGPDGDVSVFFGLSGTGKTTLSADPARKLIGDDEHVWTDTGVFNIEGGCYAKCVNLREENEPEIFRAIRFGSVVENVVLHPVTREIDYDNISITENTRCSYPLQYIPNAKLPAVTTHPTNIIMLTCDAFGVLPPVSKLTPEQAMYHFISGYTAKVAGTEQGITEPTATFSACFGAPFMVWHPSKYAEILAEKMKAHNTNAWLINTGWISGSARDTKRCPLKYTRAIIDAIHSGELAKIDTEVLPVFGLHVPVACPGVPHEMLTPRNVWKDKESYDATLRDLGTRFSKNFKQFEDRTPDVVKAAGPSV